MLCLCCFETLNNSAFELLFCKQIWWTRQYVCEQRRYGRWHEQAQASKNGRWWVAQVLSSWPSHLVGTHMAGQSGTLWGCKRTAGARICAQTGSSRRNSGGGRPLLPWQEGLHMKEPVPVAGAQMLPCSLSTETGNASIWQ
jgi:hypothetical protein